MKEWDLVIRVRKLSIKLSTEFSHHQIQNQVIKTNLASVVQIIKQINIGQFYVNHSSIKSSLNFCLFLSISEIWVLQPSHWDGRAIQRRKITLNNFMRENYFCFKAFAKHLLVISQCVNWLYSNDMTITHPINKFLSMHLSPNYHCTKNEVFR